MLSEKKIKTIKELHESGLGIKAIAKKLIIDAKTVRKYLYEKDKENSTLNSTPSKNDLSLEKTSNNEGAICAKVFELLEGGIPPTKIVQELCLLPEKVKELALKWDELRALQLNKKGVLERLDALEKAIIRIYRKLETTPLFNLRNKFECSCGEKGWVAVNITCTKCNNETWWGWFPKEDENEEEE